MSYLYFCTKDLKGDKMATKKSPIHLIFIFVYLILIVFTLIPRAAASKECILGYKALCSFTPISTAILLVLVGLHLFLHKKSNQIEKRKS